VRFCLGGLSIGWCFEDGWDVRRGGFGRDIDNTLHGQPANVISLAPTW
jgi:hypothetical protein